MRMRLIMEIIDDNGELIAMNQEADLNKKTKGAEDLGLPLSEGKALLAKLQQHIRANWPTIRSVAIRYRKTVTVMAEKGD